MVEKTFHSPVFLSIRNWPKPNGEEFLQEIKPGSFWSSRNSSFGSAGSRTTPTTFVIREQPVAEVRVCNSDIAKFDTETEQNAKLFVYTPNTTLPYKKRIEENNSHHVRELMTNF